MTIEQFTELNTQDKLNALRKLYLGEIKFDNPMSIFDDMIKGFGK